ncbi:MAG: WD40 repeat domain-containing protein [Planctomycetaceae bacterium]|nr:WD40 repeat domain-containing protein [Planctomycetaceae bacterium]
MRLASSTLLLASLIAGCQDSPNNNRPTNGTTESDVSEGVVPIAERPANSAPTPVLTLNGHTCIVTSVGFSPDGKRIVSGGIDQRKNAEGIVRPVGGSGEFKVWDADTGQELFTVRGIDSRWVSFTSDGEQIATTGYGGGPLKLWDAATGQPADPPAPPLLVQSDCPVSFSPDGTRIAYVSFRDTHTLSVWNLTTGSHDLIIKVQDTAKCVSFSPDGQRIAHDEYDTVKVRDATTGKLLSTFKGHPQKLNLHSRQSTIRRFSFSPDGRRIASAGNKADLKVWDTTTGRELYEADSGNHSPAFSPDGKWIVTGGAAGDDYDNILVLDAKTGKKTFTLRGHLGRNKPFESMSFSPDGSRIVSCTGSKVVEVWEFPPK